MLRAIVDTALFEPNELVVLELADKLTLSGHAVDEALWQRLLPFYDEGEITELVCAIGLFNYFNRVSDALHLDITR